MKITVNIALLLVLITTVVGWGVSVESRLAAQAESLQLSNRVRAMEELMLPLLIDWKTHKELEKWKQRNIDKIKGQVDKSEKEKTNEVKAIASDDVIPVLVKRSVDAWAKGVFKGQAESGDMVTPAAESIEKH
ncbi:MAG: hypothetical protein WC919_05210 [Candidatus Paceibacterota bacterium]|jgi:hypothetical protein